MFAFVVRRVVVSFFIVLASTALMYVLVALSGNPLKDLLEYNGPGREARIAARTAALNLDVPIPGRYVLWLAEVGRCVFPGGDGCTLVIAATVLALLLGVVTGVVTALRQYSTFDYSVTFIAFLCFSLPVFWVSTLLKQYIAIDLNTWLQDPQLTYASISLIGLAAGVIWAVVIGGDARRRLVVAAVAAAATSGTLILLLNVGWFRAPALGIGGIAVSSLVAAFLWSALFAGLRPRTRSVLYASLATAVAGTVTVALAALFAGAGSAEVAATLAATDWAPAATPRTPSTTRPRPSRGRSPSAQTTVVAPVQSPPVPPALTSCRPEGKTTVTLAWFVGPPVAVTVAVRTAVSAAASASRRSAAHGPA